jgi:hypothetical protein
MEVAKEKVKEVKTENPQPVKTGCGSTKQQ